MLSPIKELLEKIEMKAKSQGDLRGALADLRALPFNDFAAFLFHLPDKHFPTLSRLLPQMASSEVQKVWTGTNGDTLLGQSIAFVRTLSASYLRICDRELSNLKILDFGCGYGRHLRLMHYYSDPNLLYGCDPWNQSIELCRSAGLQTHLALSDYLPQNLPFADTDFDLIYCFSVFTHLSKRAAHAALDTLRQHIASNGLLVLTIRPVDYWHIHCRPGRLDDATLVKLVREHREQGFAFHPRNRTPVDGDITFGDTSISLDYIRQHFCGWEMISSEQSASDPYQIIVFLRPCSTAFP